MNLERTVIALGFFDGVHRGHGALLQKTVQRAGELGAIPGFCRRSAGNWG